MRYAIVSDIHANLQAWQAVVADMASLQIDHIICVGDIVGYGPDPSPITEAIRQHASVTVVGNHDAAACGRMDTSLFNDNAREAIEWTTGQLSENDVQYLKQLPEKARPEGAGFLVVHAEVVEPMAFGYILDEEAAKASFAACDDRIIFIGHSHRAGVFVQSPTGEISIHDPDDFRCDPENRYIINPGSVGDPRSSNIVASYAVYDDSTRDVHFRRIEFDIEAFRVSIDATELVTRPFFVRYLDEVTAGGTAAEYSIPSVQETDAVPQFNLAAPEIEIKKKDPFVRIGIGVLLVALIAGIWFFAQNMPPPGDEEASDKVAAPEESKKGSSSAKVEAEPKKKKVPEVVDKLPVTARFIRVSLSRVGVLSLAEVEVYSKGENVAMRGKATQSSNHSDYSTADKAIDGNPSGKYNDHHMTHTRGDKLGWWLLDLGKEYPVELLVLWNRDEGGTVKERKKLWARLDGYTLEMLDKDKNTVFLRKNNPGKRVRNLVK